MSDQDPWGTEVHFDELNWLGKAIYISGQVARVATTVLETVVDGASELITEAERAFKDGLDPEVEEAKILEEFDDPDIRRKRKPLKD